MSDQGLYVEGNYPAGAELPPLMPTLTSVRQIFFAENFRQPARAHRIPVCRAGFAARGTPFALRVDC